jgi:hypothetical protein
MNKADFYDSLRDIYSKLWKRHLLKVKIIKIGQGNFFETHFISKIRHQTMHSSNIIKK